MVLALSGWSNPKDPHQLQGVWVSTDSSMTELRIESVSSGWHVYASGAYHGKPVDWAPGQVRDLSRVADRSDNGPLEPLQVSLQAAYGQADLRMTLEDESLLVEVSLTYVHAGGLTQERRQLVFMRQGTATADPIQADSPSQAASPVNAGVIFGEATGPAQHIASIFQISLYGPDEASRFHSTQPLHQGYRFEHLPDGLYWLFIEARGTSAAQAEPSRKLIQMEAGQSIHHPVELR
jgi:hypothetical protein